MKDISIILHSFGFLESEIRTYLASLQHGPATVLEIVKLTHLSRQATYVVIESLTKRGLMSSVIRGKKKYYVAEDPEKLLSYAVRKEHEMKDQMKDLEAVLPDLKLKAQGDHPVVRLFEGREGLRSMLSEILSEKVPEFDEIVDLNAKRIHIPPGEMKALLGLKKLGTKVRALYTTEPFRMTISPKSYVLPEEYHGFKAGITIYGDKVALFSYEGKVHSVNIENRGIAKTLKILFELAYKNVAQTQTLKGKENGDPESDLSAEAN